MHHLLTLTFFFSVACVVFLAGVIIFKSVKNSFGGPVNDAKNPVKLWPNDFGGLLTAIAISGLTFSCHFNILPMHGELRYQTRTNKRIIDLFRLYILFSQYKSCDNTQEDWSFVLFIKKSACRHIHACMRSF